MAKPFRGRSLSTPDFWKAHERLSKQEQTRAQSSYRLWLADTTHPSLMFKKVHSERPIYSVRATLDVRAVGIRTRTDMVWFWIGPHDDYEALLKAL